MAKTLTSIITNQRTAKVVGLIHTFKLNSVDLTTYLISGWGLSYDRNFGAAQATFTLNNSDGRFSEGGISQINVGDTVELFEKYVTDTLEFKKFYGLVKSRSIVKNAEQKNITLVCLDYISILQELDLDLTVEGNRVEVINEPLIPVYLPSPNQDLAQIFNFANDSIATNPLPSIKFQDLNHTNVIDTQYDGYEIYYDVGQLKLGKPLNVRYNFKVTANYSYYAQGVQIEDVIQEILVAADGYGKYLFNENTEQDLIDNHLTDTFNNVEEKDFDTLIPNTTALSIDIKTILTADVAAGAVSINVLSTEGFASAGTGSINGDTFTWNSKTANTLEGLPNDGSYALNNHKADDEVKNTNTYAIGQVWELSYNNLFTTLTSSDFTLPSGATIFYIDHKNGRIILTAAIALNSVITCENNYSFCTLQSSKVEINSISFRSREVANRFEAITKVREYVAPNYIIRTVGDNKIWANYVTQKSVADYDLDLERGITYLEDTDLYTRVIMWGKNNNPTNVMFGTEVDYISDTEDSYSGIVSRTNLEYFGEEKSGILSSWATSLLSEAQLLHMSEIERLIQYVNDTYIAKDYATQSSTGKYIFGSSISGIGGIILGDIIPTVWINSVPVNNEVVLMTSMPVKIKQTTSTTTSGGGKSKSVSVETYYYYTIIFPHSSIVPSEPIYLYDSQGLLQYTIAPQDPNVDYATGIWTIPGIERNDVAEVLSTATYKVLYSTDKLQINYNDAIFKIDRSIVPFPEENAIQATFEYWAIAIAIRNLQNVIDGQRTTQLQIEFFGEPPAGFHLATIDLGQEYPVQAIDIVGGFFRPDEYRKFDVGFKMSIEYSINGSNFYAIGDRTENFGVGGGEAVSFEEDALGSSLTARYLRFNLNEVDNIPYGKGRYVVALTEVSVYNNIIIKSEATLIPTTFLTASVADTDNIIQVTSTAEFATSGTLYINGTYAVVYAGTTTTTFTGCIPEVGTSAIIGGQVTQSLENDVSIYDNSNLLSHLGDRVYKLNKISDRNLFNQAYLDRVAKAYLKEFYKNHSKLEVEVISAPYLQVGQTVHLVDTYNNVDANYFIESITTGEEISQLVLAKYPL